MTQEAEDIYSIPSSPPAMPRSGAFHLQRMLTNQRRMSRGNSKITISSLCTGRSGPSPFVARKRASHKRNVSFNHNGRRSVSGVQLRLRSREYQPVSKILQERYIRDQTQRQPQASSSLPLPSLKDNPMPDTQPIIRSKKEGGKATEAPFVPKLRGDANWTDDVRKLSTELDQLCDTAFNRVSVSSSAPTAITPGSDNRGSRGRNLSSATSFSIFQDPLSERDALREIRMKDVSAQAYQQRPLPPLPTMDPLAEERLGSFTQRELAKTRDLLKKRNRASYMEPGYLDDVIAHLDRLMQPSNVRLVNEERRAVTDPTSNGLSRKDTFEQIMENGNIGFRSTSEPSKESNKGQKHRQSDQTIRTVENATDGYKPISPIQPLTIRKKSGASSIAPSPTTPIMPPFPVDGSQALSSDRPDTRSIGLTLLDKYHGPIKETEDFDPVDRNRKNGGFREYKKRSWFRSQPQPKPSIDIKIFPPLPPKDHHQVYNCGQQQKMKRFSATSDESQASESKKGIKSGRFFKMFTGKRDDKSSGGSGDYHLNNSASFDTEESYMYHRSRELKLGLPTVSNQQHNASSVSTLRRRKSQINRYENKSNTTQGEDKENTERFLMPSPSKPAAYLSAYHSRPIRQRASNWFARFLGIKPAVHVLCFQISKLRARKEVAKVFREWRKFGMQDVVVDKLTCRVWARIGKDNCSYPFSYRAFPQLALPFPRLHVKILLRK